MSFRAIILGAAAGGGLPQWNCGCENCDLARRGDIPAASQSSLAVSVDGSTWAVINASPDIRMQMAAVPALHPRAPRDTPVDAVLLTNGDLDHVGGLLTLREAQPFRLLATGDIHAVLAANPVFSVGAARRETVATGVAFDLLPGLRAELFPVPGKVPLYLEGEGTVATDVEGDQTVGVRMCDGSRVTYYVPGCAAVTDRLRDRLADAHCIFFDGTLWADDEMVRAGLGSKTGRRMGHVSMGGPDGSLASLGGLAATMKVYVHMNNTNPVLRPDTEERRAVEAAGWTIGRDGMEVRP